MMQHGDGAIDKMKHFNSVILAGILAGMTAVSVPALADVADGSLGSGKKAQSRSMEKFPDRPLKLRQAPKRGDVAARSAGGPRSLPEDDDAFSLVRKNAKGEVTKRPPSDAIKQGIRDGRRADASAVTEDETEEARAIVGRDDRIRLDNAYDYPFSATGMLLVSFKGDDSVYACSAALVGPATVITTAFCIYDHELQDPWYDKASFWPGLNGEDYYDGAFASEGEVLNGWISNYDGTYGSVWDYDVALLNLEQPVGDDVGWFGSKPYTARKGFDANLAGYLKEDSNRMWRSKCRVGKGDIGEIDIIHTCDADDAARAYGAPLFIFHGDDKPRQLVGFNQGAADDNSNWAMKVDNMIANWIGEFSR